MFGIKTAENFPLQQESPVPNESDGGKLQKRDPLANTSECKNKDTPTIFVAPNKDASTNDEEISTTTRGLTTKEIKITVKKTSQPLGLVLTVFDGGMKSLTIKSQNSVLVTNSSK